LNNLISEIFDSFSGKIGGSYDYLMFLFRIEATKISFSKEKPEHQPVSRIELHSTIHYIHKQLISDCLVDAEKKEKVKYKIKQPCASAKSATKMVVLNLESQTKQDTTKLRKISQVVIA